MNPPPSDPPDVLPPPTSFARPDAATRRSGSTPWTTVTPSTPWPPPSLPFVSGTDSRFEDSTEVAPNQSRGGHRWRWVGLAGVVLLVGAFALTRPRSSPYAKAWDARVTDLVAFVEQERGLTFKHPVAFDFMTDSEFVADISDGRPQPVPERQSLTESILRARGYIGQSFSSASVEQDFLGNVTGYYSHDDKRMRVRGTELSAYIKLTLVHELTHALQDQWFGINSLYAKVSSDEQAFAMQSLIEGDARSVENAYYRSLATVDQRAIDDTEHPSDQPDRLSHTPDALQVRDGAPYELGAQMVDTLRHLGGVDRLNEAFRHPPKGEAAVLFPFAVPVKTSTPPPFTASAGEQAVSVSDTIDQRSVGPLSTFLTLSSRLDATSAWRASTGWGSERIKIVHRLGNVCIDSMILGRTAADSERLYSAYASWATFSTGATVTRQDEAVLVQSCDPKTAAPEPNTGIFSELFQFTETDLALFRRAETDGIPANRAACAVLGAHQHVDALALDPADLQDDQLPSTVVQALDDAIAECKA